MCGRFDPGVNPLVSFHRISFEGHCRSIRGDDASTATQSQLSSFLFVKLLFCRHPLILPPSIHYSIKSKYSVGGRILAVFS